MKPYYEEDGITIYHGNCFDVFEHLPKVDLILTDPPYGVGLKYDIYDDSDENWTTMFSRLIPVIKNKATMSVLPCCQIRKLPYIYQNFPPDWLIIWAKGSPGHRAFVGFNDYEPLLTYGKLPGVQMHDHFYCQPDTNGSADHPCPKPLGWYRWLISRCIGDGKTVCDPFLGSGTAAVVCKEMGIDFVGIELSEKYCELAVRKLKNTVKSMFPFKKEDIESDELFKL